MTPVWVQSRVGRTLRARLRVSGPERQRTGAGDRSVASVSVKAAGGHGSGRAPVQW